MKPQFVFLAVLTMFACKKDEALRDPVACFNTNKRLYKAGETVYFQNCSRDAQRVLWDFGNGQNSSSIHPEFTWQTKGSFPVSLTVWNGDRSNTLVNTISVADCTYVGFRAVFSNWQNGFQDSLLQFFVYTRLGNVRSKQYEFTKKLNEPLDTLETGIRPDNVNEPFFIDLVVQRASGKKDSLQSGPHNLADAPNNTLPLRNSLGYVTVEHLYTLFYK